MNLLKLFRIGCACLVIATPFRVAAETLRLTNGEWPPYMSKEMENYGVFSQIVTEAFALEGVTVEYGFFPWKRSFEYAKSGTWDGTIAWTRTEERGQWFYFSEMVMAAGEVIFQLKEKPIQWAEVSDLRHVKIGGTIGYNYGDEFMEAEKKGIITVDRSVEDVVCLKKLLHGRLDGCVIDIHTGYYVINENFSKAEVARLTHHAKHIRRNHTTCYFPKKSPVAAKWWKNSTGV